MAATLTNTEIAEWASRVYVAATPAARNRGSRLEVVRVLREQSYIALRPGVPGWSLAATAAAEAILDTPIDALADMVVMSDTVMGNWRTIAATVLAVV